MKLYYCEKYDIFAIVEGVIILKYVGELGDNKIFMHVVEHLNVWYQAFNHPENFDGFELIGEIE